LVRALVVVAKIVVPVVLLAVVAFGLLYVKLLNGPISVKALAGPLARSIQAELPDTSATVEDALVTLSGDGKLELRLRGLMLADQAGAPIAVAPQAAFAISLAALWSGRIAPERVTLLEPRVLVSYTPEAGLALSFSRPIEDASKEKPDAPMATAPAVDERVDIGRLISDVTGRARRRGETVSYLRDIGVKNATVILDTDGRQTVWRIIEADLDLQHRKRSSTVDGNIAIATARGPAQLAFRIEEAERAQTVVVTTTLRDLVPGSIAGLAPQLKALEIIEAPVSIDARIEFGPGGRVGSATGRVKVEAGPLRFPGLVDTPIQVETGLFDLAYDGVRNRVELADGAFAWSGGRIALNGTVERRPNDASGWVANLAVTDGVLIATNKTGARTRLEAARLTALFDNGRFRSGQMTMKAGGATFSLNALGEKGNQPFRLDGSATPVSLATLQAVWPAFVAPKSRRWVAERVEKATIQSATLKLAGLPSVLEGTAAPRHPNISLTVEATDVRVAPIEGMAIVEAPRALVRVDGNSLEVTVPDAALVPAPGRRITAKAGRLTSTDIHADRSPGELTFRAQSGVLAALDFLVQEPLTISRSLLPTSEGLDGKVDGQFTLRFPLAVDVTSAEVKASAKVTISDLKGKQAIGGFDLQGGRIAVDVGERTIEAKGDLLVAGVNAKLQWQRILGASDEQQPPPRITVPLDTADRAQLGLDVAQFVQGETPLEITLVKGPRNEPLVRVRGELTNADLVIQGLSWRKPPGRPASVQFDVAKGTKHKTELQNFKLVGDDIAIDGWLALDGQNKLREFYFPSFSLNVVTRLELQGQLRQDNVWDVKASGQTFDGRDIFRSLFSVGEIVAAPRVGASERTGLDLKADIQNVIGFSEIGLRSVRVQLSKRQDALSALIARGVLDGGRPLDIALRQGAGGRRVLEARSDDAGQVLKLVGFYPNLQGGKLRLDVDLDARGPVEKNGILFVESFQVLGDPVVSEVFQFSGDVSTSSEQAGRGRQRIVRQVFEFEWMRVPFLVGNQQFVLQDAEVRGPLFGALVRGKADLRARTVNLGGSYIPLQGLNAAIGAIPGIGQLLAGPKGEGVLGITFAVQGSMAQPQVTVNPLSLLTPGVTRELMQMTSPTPGITPAAPKSKAPAATAARTKASSAPATATPGAAGPSAKPRIQDGWSSQTTPSQ
jgi:hypothetical protein